MSRTVDLHMHTTRSDGRLTPTALVRLLTERKVSVASITDHDSTMGLDEAFEEAQHHPDLRLVPGVEISADNPLEPNTDIHLLGYFFDPKSSELQARLRRFREERDGRGQAMVERLGEIGKPVDWERVKEIAGDAAIGRPHIALAMVERGYIKTAAEAFRGYLDDDGIAFVSRPHLSMADAVAMVEQAGGITVLAHPLYINNYEVLLGTLKDAGVVGFEVHYAQFSKTGRKALAAIARDLDLLPCGGSDYHAMGYESEPLPGSAGPPLEVVQELERLAVERRRR